MANSTRGVLALYKYLDDFTHTIEKIRSRPDFDGHELFTPTSYHEVEHAAHYGNSPVRFFTLVGALTGTITGFGLCLALDYDWLLVVGGKQGGIPSLPAYVVIGFELTILLGALATIFGMLFMGRIPDPKKSVLDPRLTNDHFGVFVPGVDESSSQAKFLRETGALEIRMVEEFA